MKRTLPNVSSKYGAPMGRRNNIPSDIISSTPLYLEKLKIVDGAYDVGGAYWGGNFDNIGDMYWAQGETSTGQIDIFVRAHNREEAKEMVTNEIISSISDSMIKFYR
jgi:hypothetical protein